MRKVFMYKVIPEFPRWEINEYGKIRSVKTKEEKYTLVNKQGYYHTQFKKDGKVYCRKIHRLVGEIFLPEPPDWLNELCLSKWPFKPCLNHKDHNKLNNHVSNLEWCDINHNNQEAIKAGVVPPLQGSKNGRAILTEDLVHKICKDFESGMMPLGAVEKYGISKQQATKIRAGFQWKHVWVQYDIKVNRRKKST